MDNGATSWESLDMQTSTSQPSPNPWIDSQSTTPSLLNSLSPPNTSTRPRGSSTSINPAAVSGSIAGIPSMISTTSIGASTSSLSTGEGLGNNLRPRAGLRRLKSDLASDGQTPDSPLVVHTSPKLHRSLTSGSTSDREARFGSKGRASARGDTVLIDTGSDSGRGAVSRNRAASNVSSVDGNRRATSKDRETQDEGDWDDDDNDKTRESKVRKGKRRANNGPIPPVPPIPGAFTFGLGSRFGAKLWEDVENLLTSTLAPGEVYAGENRRGGHAYLDVWGQPIQNPNLGNEEARGRERSNERLKGVNGGWRTPGPLVETDTLASTTPGLLKKTTDTIRDREAKRLVSSEGVDVLDPKRSLSREGEAQTEVFEHKVLPTDSLARVALKYGTTVAQLRKCNKMWASDTIHLRKVLYIPVSSTRPTAPPAELIDLSDASTSSSPSKLSRSTNGVLKSRSHTPTPSPSKTASSIAGTSSNYALSESTSSMTASKSVSSTPSTKRVPLSELSYFPPPTVPSTTIFTSNPHPSTISAGQIRKWEIENGTSASLFGTVGASPFLSTSPNDRLLSSNSRATSPSRLPASIFNVFPSLNDLNITSRVSFESVRSTGGSLPGSGNVSGEEDVELDELVKQRGKPLLKEGTRDLRKRVKLKPRAGMTEGPKVDGTGKVITEQLGPQRMMELPAVGSPGPGAYGNGWKASDGL